MLFENLFSALVVPFYSAVNKTICAIVVKVITEHIYMNLFWLWAWLVDKGENID